MRDPKYKGTWQQSAANEFGRLAQGVGGRYKGKNTIFFIHKNQVPHDRMKDVTYRSFSCEYKPNKAEKERNGRRRQNKLHFFAGIRHFSTRNYPRVYTLLRPLDMQTLSNRCCHTALILMFFYA